MKLEITVIYDKEAGKHVAQENGLFKTMDAWGSGNTLEHALFSLGQAIQKRLRELIEDVQRPIDLFSKSE